MAPSFNMSGLPRLWTSFSLSPNAITIHALNHAVFPFVWLRDSCQSPHSVHPSTKQKLHRTPDIPHDVAPLPGENGIRVTENALEVLWMDGRKSVFDKRWLEIYSNPASEHKYHWDHTLKEQCWTRKAISALPYLFIPYKEITSSDAGLLKAIDQLLIYGLVIIRGVPHQDTSDDNCELKKLALKFGELRRTFYGLVWNVVNQKDSKNIAYTNLDLGLHMDLMYFEHPPRYQILHCLRNRVIGGTSIFVDGLQAAQVLRNQNPSYFQLLSRTPVSFHYINDGHHLHRKHPTIELSPLFSDSSALNIRHINYSPPFQAPLPLSTPTEFYPAFKRFSDILNHEENVFQYTLEEGDAAMFDNRRVLHGRTSFRNMIEPERLRAGRRLDSSDSGPERWLKGCYLEADAILDRVRILKTIFAQKKDL